MLLLLLIRRCCRRCRYCRLLHRIETSCHRFLSNILPRALACERGMPFGRGGEGVPLHHLRLQESAEGREGGRGRQHRQLVHVEQRAEQLGTQPWQGKTLAQSEATQFTRTVRQQKTGSRQQAGGG
jgi:hypothetical protein